MYRLILSVVLILAALLLAIALQSKLGLSDQFLLKFLVSTVFLLAVLALCIRTQLPDSGFGVANQVTLSRALLALVLLAFIGEANTPATMWCAVAVASVAACSDAVDGWLARKTATGSDFGARFDMESDALFIAVLVVLAYNWQRAGLWVLLAGAARYLFVVASWVFVGMRRELPASQRRKVICVLQVVALIVCIAPILTPTMSAMVAAIGVSALLYSFLLDIVWLLRRQRVARPAPRAN